MEKTNEIIVVRVWTPETGSYIKYKFIRSEKDDFHREDGTSVWAYRYNNGYDVTFAPELIIADLKSDLGKRYWHYNVSVEEE